MSNTTPTDLWMKDFSGQDLSDADFSGQDLWMSSFSGARLFRANFARADLRGTSFLGSALYDADFRGAHLDWGSHEVLAEILRQAAGDNVQRRMLAGLFLVSRDRGCTDLLALDLPERQWAIDTLQTYATELSPFPTWRVNQKWEAEHINPSAPDLNED